MIVVNETFLIFKLFHAKTRYEMVGFHLCTTCMHYALYIYGWLNGKEFHLIWCMHRMIFHYFHFTEHLLNRESVAVIYTISFYFLKKRGHFYRRSHLEYSIRLFDTSRLLSFPLFFVSFLCFSLSLFSSFLIFFLFIYNSAIQNNPLYCFCKNECTVYSGSAQGQLCSFVMLPFPFKMNRKKIKIAIVCQNTKAFEYRNFDLVKYL